MNAFLFSMFCVLLAGAISWASYGYTVDAVGWALGALMCLATACNDE